MTALAADANVQQWLGGAMPELLELPVYTATTIYKGSIVCVDTSHGYAVVGATSTTLIPFGIAEEGVVNAGSSGAKTVKVRAGVFRFVNSGTSITVAHTGQRCYIVDDQTVHQTDGTGTRSQAGTIVKVDSAGVWVAMGPYPIPDAATYVTLTGTQVLTNKTLTSPTINSPTIVTPTIAATGWANANHAHGAANSGGQLNGSSCFSTQVSCANGGTNLTSYTAGDMLYASGATTLAKLAKGAARRFLRMNAGATAPEWGGIGFISANAPAFAAGDCAITPDPGYQYIIQATAGNSTVSITTTSLVAGDLIAFTADGTNNGHTVQYRDGVTAITAAKTASKRHGVILQFDGTNLVPVGEVSP